jgi:hypothetical protein
MMVERIHRPHRLLLKPPQRPSIGRIMWRSCDAHWSDAQRRRRSAAEHSIPSISSGPTYPSTTVWDYAECLVPHRLIRGQYVTVTKMGHHCRTAEVPVVSVSAVVEDFPHGSICHIPTATTRRNRARARLESEPHDLGGLLLSRLRGISPGSDNSPVFPGLLSTFRGSDTGRNG